MSKFFLLFLLSTFVYLVHPLVDKKFEDAKLGTLELVKKYGYNGELYYVTTEDNYILELHRISGSPKSAPRKGKKVCLLTHGLTGQSSEWVASGPNQALAYLLADKGYDVFMANSRGTDYGLNHTTLNPFGSKTDQKQFWSFSFEEFGVYDTTATIDYILALTKQKKLQYIGHSQGGTVYFIMLSEKPEYNDKIEMAHQLAPGVPMPNVRDRHEIEYLQSLFKLFESTGVYHIAPTKAFNQMCRDVSTAKYFCAKYLTQIMGRPTDQMNMTLVPVIFGHFASNLGTHLLVHLTQIASGEFRRFNFGKVKNLEYYGEAEPPKYNLKNAKSPVAIYYAPSDPQFTPENARKLIEALPNVVLDYLVPHKAFNHGDFAYGKDARRLVYYQILKTMKSVANEEI